jgi:hypothetical protein
MVQAIDLAPDLGAAGEGKEPHALVFLQVLDDFRTAVQHREKAPRHACFQQHLGQLAGCQRRVGRGLEDHRVAGGKGRRHLVRYRVER